MAGINLSRMLAGGGGGFGQQNDQESALADTGEQIFISSMALLKMLKHGRAGVPMEVMGLMLGEFIDDYTVRVVDTFSMPQSGNSVTDEDAGHAQADWTAGSGGWVVPFSPWFRLLVLVN